MGATPLADLCEVLSGHFGKLGYRSKTLDNLISFEREIVPGFIGRFTLDTYHQGTSLMPCVYLVSTEIDDLYVTLTRRKQDNDFPRTLGFDVGKILIAQRRFWQFWVHSSSAAQHLGTAASVPKAATNLIGYFEKYAQPFFLEFSSLKAIERHLNEDPEQLSAYCRIWTHKIAKGLIAAKLLRSGELDDLLAVYSDMADRHLTAGQKRQFHFQKFEKALREMGA